MSLRVAETSTFPIFTIRNDLPPYPYDTKYFNDMYLLHKKIRVDWAVQHRDYRNIGVGHCWPNLLDMVSNYLNVALSDSDRFVGFLYSRSTDFILDLDEFTIPNLNVEFDPYIHICNELLFYVKRAKAITTTVASNTLELQSL